MAGSSWGDKPFEPLSKNLQALPQPVLQCGPSRAGKSSQWLSVPKSNHSPSAPQTRAAALAAPIPKAEFIPPHLRLPDGTRCPALTVPIAQKIPLPGTSGNHDFNPKLTPSAFNRGRTSLDNTQQPGGRSKNRGRAANESIQLTELDGIHDTRINKEPLMKRNPDALAQAGLKRPMGELPIDPDYHSIKDWARSPPPTSAAKDRQRHEHVYSRACEISFKLPARVALADRTALLTAADTATPPPTTAPASPPATVDGPPHLIPAPPPAAKTNVHTPTLKLSRPTDTQPTPVTNTPKAPTTVSASAKASYLIATTFDPFRYGRPPTAARPEPPHKTPLREAKPIYGRTTPNIPLPRSPRTIVLHNLPKSPTLAMVSVLLADTGKLETITLFKPLLRARVVYVLHTDAEAFFKENGDRTLCFNWEGSAFIVQATMPQDLNYISPMTHTLVHRFEATRVVKITGWTREGLEYLLDAEKDQNTYEELLIAIAGMYSYESVDERVEGATWRETEKGLEACLVYARIKDAWCAVGPMKLEPEFGNCRVGFGSDPCEKSTKRVL